MAVENSDIFLGSGASLTFVPEVDFFFKAQGTSDTNIQMNTTYLAQFQLVADMYVGCTIDWYDAGVYTSSHTVTTNDNSVFKITPSLATNAHEDDDFVLRGYGAPCPAPDSDNDGTGRLRLHADNWLGLVETAAFPNVEVEMKQLNLSLGSSRNFTHQYKGIETASGGNLALVCNHVTWLYYFLGQCTSLSFANATTDPPASYHTGTAADKLYFHDKDSATSHINTGPFIYRVNSVSGGDHIVPPLMFTVEDTVADIDSATYPVTDSTYVTYAFDEIDTSDLPSFALEQSMSKLATNPLRTDNDADLEDLNFVRVARGNRVNTLTLTANENEELKMTMDLNTRAVNTIPQTTAYESRGGQATDRSLFNFTTDAGHLDPFFFSDGTITFYGEEFLKITNFTLTMNNNLMDKRFVGIGSKSIKDAIPAQRTYEIALTALVTNDRLFTELVNSDEENSSALTLTFTKNTSETFTLVFNDYFTTANTWTVPEDKGPITVEATLMPRTLTTCTTTTHWVLQG